MKATKLDWKYIAGFFDGEGSVMRSSSGWRISIPQTNRNVLQSIKNTSQVGSIVHVTKRQAHWRESWTFYISRQQDVYTFLQAIRPFLIVKHSSAQTALRQLPKILRRQRQQKLLAQARRQTVNRLRQRGISYRAIGRKLGLDFGHVRRVFLRSNKN